MTFPKQTWGCSICMTMNYTYNRLMTIIRRYFGIKEKICKISLFTHKILMYDGENKQNKIIIHHLDFLKNTLIN